jgi:hypothetical protein
VASGTYTETVKLTASGTADAPIVFTAAPDATVVRTGGGSFRRVFDIQRQAWITIEGFTFTDGDPAILAESSSHIEIVHNHVTTPDKGIYLSYTSDSRVADNTIGPTGSSLLYGVYVPGGDRNQIVGNAISHATYGVYLRYGADGTVVDANVIRDGYYGLTAQWSGDTLITRNVIFGNGAWGIRILGADSDSVKPKVQEVGTRIAANTLAGNTAVAAAGTYVGFAEIDIDGASKTVLANNIIDAAEARAAVYIAWNSISGTTLDHDLIDAPAGTPLVRWEFQNYSSIQRFNAATGQEAHGIQGDPRFAAPAEGDYTLTAASPAVDSGSPASCPRPRACRPARHRRVRRRARR